MVREAGAWWPEGGDLISATVREQRPSPLCAQLRVNVGGVVRPGGCGGEDARRGNDPADAASPPGLPLTLNKRKSHKFKDRG